MSSSRYIGRQQWFLFIQHALFVDGMGGARMSCGVTRSSRDLRVPASVDRQRMRLSKVSYRQLNLQSALPFRRIFRLHTEEMANMKHPMTSPSG